MPDSKQQGQGQNTIRPLTSMYQTSLMRKQSKSRIYNINTLGLSLNQIRNTVHTIRI